MLRRVGIDRVRPLAGGMEAWVALQFPLVPLVGEAVRAADAADAELDARATRAGP